MLEKESHNKHQHIHALIKRKFITYVSICMHSHTWHQLSNKKISKHVLAKLGSM